ncbi:hypothetical protein AB1Y20_001440 [Prymnesium parvum]|uniref:Uncharacterized protein n=1 Tax=Prymnesium parvum TaxID=97485 RepID=A0AB34K9K3_PRYPA
MLRPADELDEEELQELQPQRATRAEAADASLAAAAVAEARRLAEEAPFNCAAVTLLLVMSVAVICIMAVRDARHEWEECDENTKMAKHFYCFNLSAAPGVHRRLALHFDPISWQGDPLAWLGIRLHGRK